MANDDDVVDGPTIARAEGILAARHHLSISEAGNDLRVNAAFLGIPVDAFAAYIVTTDNVTTG